MSRKSFLMLWIAVLTLVSLACGSLEFGVVTPTSDDKLISVEATQEPAPEMSIGLPPEELYTPTVEAAEEFSHLWVEYWNPVFNYGLALPSHWLVQTESESGFMSTRSYDMDFFDANSIKGNWIGDEAPEGAVKLDFVPLEGIVPEQTLEVAISEMLGADSEMAVILSAEELTIGDHKAVQVTTARSFNLEDTTTSIAFRLSPETVLLVAAYPNSGLYSNDVQTILSTLVLDKSTPIVKPTTAPHPALTANSDPPSPGALPPSATCDTGYLGVLEESIDLITNSIETGNHYPLSYTIGNPFVIGYWRSEGVALPREEAYQQLTENYLPSPEEVVIITDPAQFPNLDGMPLDSFWGPDVDVVANLYSKGWGPDRQGEAILVIARCQGETDNAYFWYGMLYALSGFE